MDLKTYEFNEIQVGQKAEWRHTLTQEDVNQFVELTGDRNPLHVDATFAAGTNYRKPVVHGMLTASYVSSLIGMALPGKGALWTSQTFEFIQPAFVGDTLTVLGEVTQKSEATRLLVLAVSVTNQHGQVLVKGTSHVRLLEEENTVIASTAKQPPRTEQERERFATLAKTSDFTKRVLVTGGSRGIGRAVVQSLLERGYTVAFTYNRAIEEANALVSQMRDRGYSVEAFQVDLAQDLTEFFSKLEKDFGPVGGFVHCAAPSAVPTPLQKLDWELLDSQLSTQVKAGFKIFQRLYPRMLEEKKGSLVFIGSVFTDGAPPTQQLAYVVAKGGLVSLMRSLAVECGPQGIRVNMVSPGMTKTDMIATLPEKTKLLTQMQTPLRKLAEPQDVAQAVAFLMSPEAQHISGENLRVCGGVVMA